MVNVGGLSMVIRRACWQVAPHTGCFYGLGRPNFLRMLDSVLARVKDAALEKAVLFFLRPKLTRYGELEQLTVHSSAKRLSAVIRLHGEPSPLIISEARYDIQRQGDDAFLVLHSVKASRDWVQNLLDDHLHKLPLKIPASLRRLVE